MSSENPYQSPMSVSPPDIFAGERTLGWLLFSFQGRIPRRLFWGVSIGTSLAAGVMISLLLPLLPPDSPLRGVVILVIYIPMVWIWLATQIKRWHDRNKSGWWTLINFAPIIGAIWNFIEAGCLRGTVGPNQYGPDPT